MHFHLFKRFFSSNHVQQLVTRSYVKQYYLSHLFYYIYFKLSASSILRISLKKQHQKNDTIVSNT